MKSLAKTFTSAHAINEGKFGDFQEESKDHLEDMLVKAMKKYRLSRGVAKEFLTHAITNL